MSSISDVKIVDNIFVKMHFLAKAGDVYDGHSHVFDHISILSSGSVSMTYRDTSRSFKAPHLIVVPKGIEHQFTALEDNTMFCCIHAIREGDEVYDVVKQDVSPQKAFDLLTKYPLHT